MPGEQLVIEPRAVAATVALPVARVAVDVSLSHLDRFFDYAVTPEQDDQAVAGCRVRVRFAGRLRDGFVVERCAATEHTGRLAPLQRVVSSEPVLTPPTVALVRSVADHCAGSFADVLRLAVPPRHAATEKAARTAPVLPQPAEASRASALHAYPTGPHLLAALRRGGAPRAGWLVNPTAGPSGDWADGLAAAAAATARSGRDSVVGVPDQRDLDVLQQACTRWLGAGAYVSLTADLGPAARYRAFLAALRGDVRVVIGTRAAAFAPVADLGLVAMFDDGDDLFAEPRAPYPHTREVLAFRASQSRAAAVFAAYSRSVEVHQWVQRGWLRDLVDQRGALRRATPRVAVAADTDVALARDPSARSARLPHDVFTVVRSGLAAGPVLVQVPRRGYLVSLVCEDCRDPVGCPQCGGPVHGRPGEDWVLRCGWCGRPVVDWSCPECGGHRYRAPVVGAQRTADELGLAFPQVRVRSSSGSTVLSAVEPEPAIVVATPGAEPRVPGGYAAAVLLDTPLLLLRQDLRAGEEALRRWLNVVALVRPGEEGGTVVAVGDPSGRPLQALVRIDPDGFAARELTDRIGARFPPAVKLVTVEGPAAAVEDCRLLLEPPEPTEVLGPVLLPSHLRAATGGTVPAPGPPDPAETWRLTLRTPLDRGTALVRAVTVVQSLRSTRKSEGALRVRVDPAVLG